MSTIRWRAVPSTALLIPRVSAGMVVVRHNRDAGARWTQAQEVLSRTRQRADA